MLLLRFVTCYAEYLIVPLWLTALEMLMLWCLASILLEIPFRHVLLIVPYNLFTDLWLAGFQPDNACI